MRSFIFGIGCVALVLGAACGGGTSVHVSVDAGSDRGADAAEAGRPPGVICPANTAGETRGLGACCLSASDCADGLCWNGFCTKACDATTACGAVVSPSPLPVGTVMTCAPNQLDVTFQICLPGSLSACSAGEACPTGESCALGIDPIAMKTSPAAAPAYAGICLTKLIAMEYLPAGNACLSDSPYACEDEGGYLGSACLGRRCTHACARLQDCPIGMVCGPPPYSATLGGTATFQNVSGVGVCQGRFCGQVHGEAGFMVGQVVQQGSDSLCVSGEVCAPTQAVGTAGETQYLSCVPALPGAQPYGASCVADPSQGKRCADDRLCVTRDGASFCSQLCRNDGDCPSGSVCLDDDATTPQSPLLPNGSRARLSMCAPRSRVSGTTCHAEKDCAAGSACLPVSRHSSLLVCRATTGTKNVGQACAAPAECRSGECADRDGNLPGGNNRTYCAAYCTKNSECGAGQICLRRVLSNNGTIDDPRDDVILGFCTTLAAPALNGACTSDDNCTGQINIDETGGDTCDLVNRTCYTKLAKIGDACAHRASCPLGAYCRLQDPNFEGGVCASLGCDPAALAGGDSCGDGAICLQRSTDAPLHGCYESCGPSKVCSRLAQGYACQPAVNGQSATICLTPGGP